MIEPGKHKLTEALEGQDAAPVLREDRPGAPEGGPTPDVVAEQTRREQEARSHGRPDREDYLTNVGRGDQTHG